MVDLKTFVYNVPLTYPATYSNNTVLIPGWISPKPVVAHSGITMANRIKDIITKLQMFAQWNRVKDLHGYLNELSSLVNEEVALLCELLEHLDWVLSVIILSELDWIQHRIPELQRQDLQRVRYLNHIFYSIDYLIARAVKLADFVFIVSDHGFREYPLSISVNDVLRKAELLKVSGNLKSHKGFSERLRLLLRQQASQAFAFGKVLKLLNRILGYDAVHGAKVVEVPNRY